MSTKKTIQVADNGHVYSFSVHLEQRRIELILKRLHNEDVELIISENDVPDCVLIKFYRELQRIFREHSSASHE